MREKRELLKMLSSNTETKHFNFNSSMSHEPITTRLFFHPELININTSSGSSPPHVSLSLWPKTSQGMQDDINNNNTSTVETPVLFKNLCSKDCTQKQPLQASWNNVHDSGVDTSLHL
ncbi:hypothetical protein TSUD_203580 [Trifolium subterraneum]|uniref:Uncharacterized protein n=1 Tax=Trifolium subterraneum TaxID=3900 RepID=A0A2Z6MEW5_TRISU|nr:hypothetical protein TSUD_203580 [Trifolium subterraneum]